MDIWSWVHKKEAELDKMGEARLSEIIDQIATFTCNDHHNQVDLIYPEGLALARNLGDKWVEIFIRHWHLQSQVLHRKNAKGMLDEAIQLLDFSHQEDTKNCPQRICTVQDLANCYGIADGPGYVSERINVANETLADINGSWPCYACISAEKVNALLDADKADEALQCIESTLSEIKKYNVGVNGGTNLSRSKTKALISLGQLDEAEQVITYAKNPTGSESFARDKRLLISLINAHKGDFSKAVNECLPYSEVLLSLGYSQQWCQIQFMAANANAIDIDTRLLDQFLFFANKQKEHGAVRTSIKIYSQLTKLALKNGAMFSSQIALNEIDKLIPLLNKDLGASETQKALRQEYINESKKLSADLELGELTDFLEKQFDSREKQALEFEVAFKKWPDSVEIAEVLSEIYAGFHQRDKGLEILSNFIQKHNNTGDIKIQLGHYILSYFDSEKFFNVFDENQIEHVSDSTAIQIKWLYARAYDIKGDLTNVKLYLQQCLELKPDSIDTLITFAHTLLKLKEYNNALSIWDKLIELQPEEKNYHWDRLVAATIIEKWDTIRESANILGINIEGTQGPVKEDWGYIRIQFEDELGQPDIFLAQRTGPVSAKIVGIKDSDETQRFGASIVFNPTPLNELNKEDSEGNACDSEGKYTYLYSNIKIMSQPEWSLFSIDGFHPGDEFIESLEKKLHNIGSTISQRSNKNYILEFTTENESTQDLPGYYAYILTPKTHDANQLNTLLTKHCENLKLPLIWPELLEQVGDINTLKVQQELQEKYEIY